MVGGGNCPPPHCPYGSYGPGYRLKFTRLEYSATHCRDAPIACEPGSVNVSVLNRKGHIYGSEIAKADESRREHVLISFPRALFTRSSGSDLRLYVICRLGSFTN